MCHETPDRLFLLHSGSVWFLSSKAALKHEREARERDGGGGEGKVSTRLTSATARYTGTKYRYNNAVQVRVPVRLSVPVHTSTGQLSLFVILIQGETASWICNFCFSVASSKIVWADPPELPPPPPPLTHTHPPPSLRCTLHAAGAWNKHGGYSTLWHDVEAIRKRKEREIQLKGSSGVGIARW